VRKRFFLPFDKSGLLPMLHQRGRVLKQDHGPEGITVDVELEEVWASRLESLLRGPTV